MLASARGRGAWAQRRTRSVTLEFESHHGPKLTHSQGRGSWGRGWPHSPHVSILDGPVVGGSGVSVVQHGRVLATAECEGISVSSSSSPAGPRGRCPHSPCRGQYSPPHSRGPGVAGPVPQPEIGAGRTVGLAPSVTHRWAAFCAWGACLRGFLG